MKITDVN